MLKKRYRLTESKDFQEVYKKGTTFRGDLGMLKLLSLQPDPNRSGDSSYTLDQNSKAPKIGIVVGKKVGNAVARHKHTRRIRHIIGEYMGEIESEFANTKLTYIAHKYTDDFNEIKKELKRQLDEARENIRRSTIKK